MHKELIAQSALFDQAIYTLVSLFKPNNKMKIMDRIPEATCEVIELVHSDLTKGLVANVAYGMSAEQALHSAMVKHWKHYSYRELFERLNDCVCLRWFPRFHSEPMPYFTTFQKAFKAIDLPHGIRSKIFWFSKLRLKNWKTAAHFERRRQWLRPILLIKPMPGC